MHEYVQSRRRGPSWPEPIWMLREYRGCHGNQVLRWDPEREEYVTRTGQAPAPTWIIRQHWGYVFGPVPVGQLELEVSCARSATA